MNRILIVGGGKIGSLIACLLAEASDYEVHLSDINVDAFSDSSVCCSLPGVQTTVLDARDQASLRGYAQSHGIGAIVAALPFHCNRSVAEVARHNKLHYFDLNEDVDVAKYIQQLAQGAETAFVPQCGLAPGYISIAANHLMKHFDSIDTVKMRVGALPLHPNNALKYSLTWSTDGLINEYANPCFGIEDGRKVRLLPLEGYETITLDGDRYEAFNTSGGLGTLADTYAGQVRTMNYKTIRYPGHCDKMRLLIHDLKLSSDRDTLKRILENALPQTLQDVVLVYVSVTGKRLGALFEETYVRKIYPHTIAGTSWSAIQVSTAAGLCSVVDITLQQALKGFVTQESFQLEDILANRFGSYFRESSRLSGLTETVAAQRSV